MRSEAAEALAALAEAVDGVRACSSLGLAGEELTELLRGVLRESNGLECAFTSLVGCLDGSSTNPPAGLSALRRCRIPTAWGWRSVPATGSPRSG